MASSSAPKDDDFGEEDLRILKNLCRHLRTTSFKDILDESRISQKETLPLQRPISPPSSKTSDQNNEFPECLLNPRSHDYSQIPLFQRENSNRTFISTQIPINQSFIRNRAPISSSNFASKEIRKTEQQKHKEDNTAESNKGRMKGSRVRPIDKFEEEEGLGFKEERDKTASQVRRPISNKGKMKEVLSDSVSDSLSYESDSSSSSGSLQKPKVFAKRPDSFRKLRKSPSKIFRKSRSPTNQKKLLKSPSNNLSKTTSSKKNDDKAHSKVPIHDNKIPNKMPSLKMNKDKVFVKIPSIKKPLNKTPIHHNTKDASKKSKEKSGFKKKKQKDKLKSSDQKESSVKKSGFKKLKDKFVHVLHHHHHHQHEVIVPAKHHRSPWKFVKDVVHKPSDWVAEIVTHQHPYLRQLVDHFRVNWKKKKSKDGRNEKKKNKGRKKNKVHWWSKWRKGGGVKMSNGKKKKGGKVKMGWRKGFGKKKGGKF